MRATVASPQDQIDRDAVAATLAEMSGALARAEEEERDRRAAAAMISRMADTLASFMTEEEARRTVAAMFDRMARALAASAPEHPVQPLLVHVGRLFTAPPEKVPGDWGAVATAAIEPMLFTLLHGVTEPP